MPFDGVAAQYINGTLLANTRRPDTRFGRLSLEILRACRLVVDVGIHMKQYVMHTEKEVDRYITWPAQACAYKIGEQKIIELRNKAQNTLGFPFDIRRFHSSIMELGSVPLWLLEKVIDEWIKAQMTSSGHVFSPTSVMLFATTTILSVLSVRLL
ncbi:hypothetical protein NP493_360g03037 [Ridgeia piscesae]|uniref:Uncharacterized protein n=1 Tax=Ridgeia piscesae TaxID=27915 RepID=A0AAD9NTK7_RIDPI|nr:hypothetical protein NP493_360g03037 [Ridgeia piscesae]